MLDIMEPITIEVGIGSACLNCTKRDTCQIRKDLGDPAGCSDKEVGDPIES